MAVENGLNPGPNPGGGILFAEGLKPAVKRGALRREQIKINIIH